MKQSQTLDDFQAALSQVTFGSQSRLPLKTKQPHAKSAVELPREVHAKQPSIDNDDFVEDFKNAEMALSSPKEFKVGRATIVKGKNKDEMARRFTLQGVKRSTLMRKRASIDDQKEPGQLTQNDVAIGEKYDGFNDLINGFDAFKKDLEKDQKAMIQLTTPRAVVQRTQPQPFQHSRFSPSPIMPQRGDGLSSIDEQTNSDLNFKEMSGLGRKTSSIGRGSFKMDTVDRQLFQNPLDFIAQAQQSGGRPSSFSAYVNRDRKVMTTPRRMGTTTPTLKGFTNIIPSALKEQSMGDSLTSRLPRKNPLTKSTPILKMAKSQPQVAFASQVTSILQSRQDKEKGVKNTLSQSTGRFNISINIEQLNNQPELKKAQTEPIVEKMDEDSFLSSEIVSTSEDENYKEMLRQNILKAQRAKEAEEALLKRSCQNLMSMIKDQSEMAKLVQFKKFYPEVYSKAAKDLKNVGSKTPIVPQHYRKTDQPVFNKTKSIVSIETLGFGALKTAKTARSISLDNTSTVEKLIIKQPVPKTGQRGSKSSTLQLQFKQNLNDHTSLGRKNLLTWKNTLDVKESDPVRIQIRQQRQGQLKSALLRKNAESRFYVMPGTAGLDKNLSKSQSMFTPGRQTSQDLQSVGKRNYLLSSLLVDAEISRRLSGSESKRINSARLSTPKEKQIFLKKDLLERLEARYANNEGSLLLVKGIIEHIFGTKRLKNNRRKVQEKFEKITMEELKIYLVDYLLTDDHNTLMETAFSLYLYMCRNKLVMKPPRSPSHTQLSKPFSGGNIGLKSQSTLRRQSLQHATSRISFKQTRVQLGVIPEASKDEGQSFADQKRQSFAAARRQSVISSSDLSFKTDATQGRTKMHKLMKRRGTMALEDFESEAMLALRQVPEEKDLFLTDADLFKIIATPSISFMSNDIAELVRLMASHGNLADRKGENKTTNATIEDADKTSSPLLAGGKGSARTMGSEGGGASNALNETSKTAGGTGRTTGALSVQLRLEQQQQREAQQFKRVQKRVRNTYDRSFMPSKEKKDLRKSIIQLKRNRSEVDKTIEERTGKKPFVLDEDLLGHDFTPYKLRLIEQSKKLQNNALFLKNIFHKPGSSSQNNNSKKAQHHRLKSQDEMVQNLSQAIQKKAVLKKYRNMNSACSLYTLVNQNPEPFLSSDEGSSDYESAEKRQRRDKLLKKVSCPLKYEVQTKVIKEKSKSNKNITVKRPFIKLVKVATNFQNPWERTAKIGPDGTFKFKQGLERLLLTKKEQKNFTEAVRINTRLKEFRTKAIYDKDGAARKLTSTLSMQDFKDYVKINSCEGIPEIIIVAIALIYGHRILTFFLKEVLQSPEVCQVEEWPKIMAQDPKYYLLCHKQIKIEGENLLQDQTQLVPRTVIRSDVNLPVVMSTFRTNALQHANFFHFFMNQSVSYNKIADSSGKCLNLEVSSSFLEKVDPIFSQLCDPYTSYNEGLYGITLVQLTVQSDLLFGILSPYFGERVFYYLLTSQRRTLVALQGGENRFKSVTTPKDYIGYQAFLDFCFDCVRDDVIVPFDRREIEIMMLDRNNMQSIDQEDIDRFEQGVNALFKNTQAQQPKILDPKRNLYKQLEILASVLQSQIKKKAQSMRVEREEAAQNEGEEAKDSFKPAAANSDAVDIPKLFTKEYLEIIDDFFGPKESPILDLIALQIKNSRKDIIKFNTEAEEL